MTCKKLSQCNRDEFIENNKTVRFTKLKTKTVVEGEQISAHILQMKFNLELFTNPSKFEVKMNRKKLKLDKSVL